MSALETFVAHNAFWTYAILFGGMFIEGEAFFVTAAIFALQGYLKLNTVVLVTFVGVILGDIAWYLLGRYAEKIPFIGTLLRIKFSRYHEWLDENFISRYYRMAFFSKFLYYINRLTPLIAGWRKMEFKKFIKIHLGAATLWLLIMTVLSHLLGLVIEAIGVKAVLRKMEFVFIGLIVLFVTGEYLLKTIFAKKITGRR